MKSAKSSKELFGFEDEAGAAIEVDLARGGAAVGVVERDGAFEDVGVFGGIGAGGIGVREGEEVAEFGEEEIFVGTLRALGVGPAGDKVGDGIVRRADARKRGGRNRAKARLLAKGKFRGGDGGRGGCRRLGNRRSVEAGPGGRPGAGAGRSG